MMTKLRRFWHFSSRETIEDPPVVAHVPAVKPSRGETVEVKLNPEDPLHAYLLNASGVVEIDKLDLESSALGQLKHAGVKISVPLVSQGELIGVLNLGNRLSEQEYSTDDRRLLNTLATQAAPALRVAQLARQQQAEARQRERLEQELRVARIIQETLLPKELPALEGWQVAAHWQPARAVSGDFYDFITFPDGRLGIAAGDVTDKGVPAALVMATTRSILRSATERFSTPGQILGQANNLLCPDIPPNMFVTCLFIILDPSTGKMRIANAGHDLPILHTANGVVELNARGMPLGLFPNAPYDEIEATMSPGDSLLIYSDGLVEAHNPQREMFGFPRLRELMASLQRGSEESHGKELIPYLLKELADFTGPGWEQEDDVTFVIIDHNLDVPMPVPAGILQEESLAMSESDRKEGTHQSETRQLLVEFELPSEPGNELLVMDKVLAAVQGIDLPELLRERLKTAVAEAAMNAIEHGNKYQEDLPVEVKVFASPASLAIQITDHGGGQAIPEPDLPDIDAKLAGLQSPRGWGLFLIRNMVDEMNVSTDDIHHTVELVFDIPGDHS
jgi:serine phosphatase RsbU (regulator of sigma subunit)/anti-sigma regulatory factor (Ser/Thr protein kinase)